MSKGLDVMAAMLTKDSDNEDVQRALAYLNVEKSLARKFDKAKDDSLRDLVYGLLESMHASLNEWNEERNQKKEIGVIPTQTEGVMTLSVIGSTQTEEEFPMSFIGPIIPPCETSLPMDNHASNNQSTIPDSSHTVPIEPKEEPIDIHQSLPLDYQISASELMRDEKMFKDEEMGNENNELIAANSDPILSDSLDILEHTLNPTRSLSFNAVEDPTDFCQILPGDRTTSLISLRDEMEFKEEEAPNDDLIQPSEIMDYQMDFDHEPSGDHDLQENNSLNEVSMRIEDAVETAKAEINGNERAFPENDLLDNEGEEEEDVDHPTDTTKDTPNSAQVDKRRRSSRNVSKSVQYNDSMDDSDGYGGPFMKKSRSDSMKKDDKARRSFKGDDQSDDVTKRILVVRKNDTELKCPECEFRAQSVNAWVMHLIRTHSKTPALAGLALLCECGHESLSDRHSRTCAGNTTVIHKSDGPQCVQCEMHPKTAIGYVRHLRCHHNSTLSQNRIYLKCSCGIEVRSQHSYKHLNDCNPRQFTLHKLDD